MLIIDLIIDQVLINQSIVYIGSPWFEEFFIHTPWRFLKLPLETPIVSTGKWK